MDSWTIRRNQNIVYATLAEDQHDAYRRFKQQRTEEEWTEIIKIKDQYRIGCLKKDVSYGLDKFVQVLNMTYWPQHDNGTQKKLTEMSAEERRLVARESLGDLDNVLTKEYAENFDAKFAQIFGVK